MNDITETNQSMLLRQKAEQILKYFSNSHDCWKVQLECHRTRLTTELGLSEDMQSELIAKGAMNSVVPADHRGPEPQTVVFNRAYLEELAQKSMHEIQQAAQQTRTMVL